MIDLVFGIDDDETASFIVGISIKKTAFAKSFVPFTTPTKALEYFDKQKLLPESERKIPDLIFLDLQMPMIDGWEFLESFNKQNSATFPNTKFIILSSSVDPEDVLKSKNEPAVIGFFQKPLKFELIESMKEFEHLKPFFNN